MQDTSDSHGSAEPEPNDQSTPVPMLADVMPPSADAEVAPASTVLAEVLPGVAVVFGEVLCRPPNYADVARGGAGQGGFRGWEVGIFTRR